jgi:hypothetical protein
MRPLLALILLLLASGGALHAQEQESKLIQRLLHWDMSLDNSMQYKTYYAGSNGVDLSKSANVKEFDFIQKFAPKTFETKEYASKNYWAGDFQFGTKTATVKADSDGDKVFATKAANVKEARESGKDYATKDYTTREAIEKGKTSQAHLDETYLGKPRMNMDEVRDLLNKDHRAATTEITSPQ